MHAECGSAFSRDLVSLACLEAALQGVLRMLDHARWAGGAGGVGGHLGVGQGLHRLLGGGVRGGWGGGPRITAHAGQSRAKQVRYVGGG
jgi:hypothetical protein